MSDDRPVHTDALATLGTVIDETASRDAIHIAVEPVIAGERLGPGQRVSLCDGVAFATGVTVGVVDPFLKNSVFKGERFWLLVLPRTITSLRHVWEHPSFPNSSAEAPLVDRSYSEQWMRNWAKQHMGYDYYESDWSDEKAYQYAISAGHNHTVGPYEDARDHIDSEWWGHWEVITGTKGDRDEYFSCGC